MVRAAHLPDQVGVDVPAGHEIAGLGGETPDHRRRVGGVARAGSPVALVAAGRQQDQPAADEPTRAADDVLREETRRPHDASSLRRVATGAPRPRRGAPTGTKARPSVPSTTRARRAAIHPAHARRLVEIEEVGEEALLLAWVAVMAFVAATATVVIVIVVAQSGQFMNGPPWCPGSDAAAGGGVRAAMITSSCRGPHPATGHRAGDTARGG